MFYAKTESFGQINQVFLFFFNTSPDFQDSIKKINTLYIYIAVLDSGSGLEQYRGHVTFQTIGLPGKKCHFFQLLKRSRGKEVGSTVIIIAPCVILCARLASTGLVVE